MANLGPFPVEFGTVFPSGVYAAGGFEKVRDFEKSKGELVIQQADKVSGLPLWVIEVIDADPEARQRTVKVKVAAEYQPVLPPAPPGAPFTPVEFEGLQATPYVDASRCKGEDKGRCRARQAYSLKATGVRAPARLPVRPAPEHTKDAA
ncbi:MAG: plasmid replication, integration and excision activator [Streptosporangiaceae bacterium]